eukprot:1182234-Prorocentrum_minimum.AAC.1
MLLSERCYDNRPFEGGPVVEGFANRHLPPGLVLGIFPLAAVEEALHVIPLPRVQPQPPRRYACARNIHTDAHNIHIDAHNIHTDAHNIHTDAHNIHTDAHNIHTAAPRTAPGSAPIRLRRPKTTQSEEGREDIPGAGTNRRRDRRIFQRGDIPELSSVKYACADPFSGCHA